MKNSVIIALLVLGFTIEAQNKPARVLATPNGVVEAAFLNEFGSIKPKWESDYTGFDYDQQRFIATFQKDNELVSVYYDKFGKQLAFQESLAINKVPKNIMIYLKDNFTTFKINEAATIKKENQTLYEIGIGNKNKFYVAQFNYKGDFLQILEK